MGMNDDLKINFDKAGKACKQVGEEWEKMMKENNPFDTTIGKIVKDIIDKQDKEIALEFTKCIGKLLMENGVTPKIEEYKTGGVLKDNHTIEEYYGVAITGLDFSEHDRNFKDEIAQLKCDLEKTYNQLMETEKKTQTRIEELESELSVKENLMKIKNGLLGNSDDLPTDPIEVAQMLINAEYVRETNAFDKFRGYEGDTIEVKKYSIDDLRQIAAHLMVYCRHNKEGDE